MICEKIHEIQQSQSNDLDSNIYRKMMKVQRKSNKFTIIVRDVKYLYQTLMKKKTKYQEGYTRYEKHNEQR